jgi:hypothetical protein
MIHTIFLLGPSDIEAQNPTSSTSPESGGVRVTTDLAGVLPILPYVMHDKTLCANSTSILVDVHTIRLPRNARVNLFNLVGNADSSSNMLQKIQHIANEIQPRRFFNQPSRVFRTSRGRLSATLADIPGCVVPRTETANPKTFSELRTVCEKFNRWPMVVRARGYHGGENMLLLHNLAQLEAVEDQSWPYTGIVLSQFIDSRNEDGLYHKARVIMVDGIPYPRHCIYSDQWAIHAGSRANLMHQDLELCHREEHFLADLFDRGPQEYAPVFNEIHQRIGLDVFGIDFALIDGQIVIFEANPCMKFLDRHHRDDNRYHYLDGRVKDLKQAIKKMLMQA